MFFIPYRLYLSGMFLMKKGCLPGHLFVGENHDKEQILYIFKINIFSPGNRPCRLPTSLDLSHAFGGGRDEAGLGSSFCPFSAAATTKTGPRNEPQGLEVGGDGSFYEETRVCITQSIIGWMIKEEKTILYCRPP